MPILENPPLIEAIFELRWGEIAPGQFFYSNDDQSLFAGMVSVAAATKGYKFVEQIQQNPNLPMFVSHRFRKKERVWPCFQIGLGIFTVNQVKDEYSWSSFKQSIKSGIEIFEQADSSKIDKVKDNLSMVLRYQDAFFPEKDESIKEYLGKHFNVKVGLPIGFSENSNLNSNYSSINLKIDINSINPKGIVTIMIAHAIINDEPGLLMETIVQSKARDVFESDSHLDSILKWVEMAHDIQKHSFRTLISPSAYDMG
ncbi:TIGR04255 family protein [Methylobacter sp.]|uniref:TIGR04255 family protein n=1 Tax=Methylobacter sp. TaxID=2051955 RepID=UPI003DA69703